MKKVEQEHPRKIGSRILLAGLFAACMGLFLMFYWAIRPYDVLVINNNPFPIRPERIMGAQPIILKTDFCKNVDVEGKLERQLVSDKVKVLMPDQVERTPVGCQKNLEVPMLLPPIRASDKYHLHFKATYHPNPLRTIVVEFDSKPFFVDAVPTP